MRYDDDQRYAIETDGKLLVSASAGSGKTAVLTRRFLRLVEDGADMESILVLTFSEKAAAEMKERIGVLLGGYLAELDAKKAAAVANAFFKVNISTIHSFLHKLATKYFVELDIDPYFSIIDEETAARLKEKAFSELLKRYNTSGDALYDGLAFSLSGSRSDAGLFEALEEYRTLLTAQIDDGYDFDESLRLCKDYLIGSMRRKLGEYLDISKNLADNCPNGHACAAVADEIFFKLQNLAEARSDADFCARLESLQKSNARISVKDGDEVSEGLSALKKRFNETLKDFKAQAAEMPSLIEQAEADRELIYKFVELEKFYSVEYSRLKAVENKLDYSDLERFAVRLLDDGGVVAELKARYKHILVDEYQDTSAIQEYILSKIENENLFTVGDVKQSIFNFRLADPTIFLERQARYLEQSSGKVRNLNNNYRTSARVVDVVNRIFSVVMTEKNGGVDYKNQARLISATDYAPEEYTPYFAAFFERERAEKKFEAVYGLKDDQSPEASDSSRDEGLYISKVIKQLLNKKIYVPSEGRYRPVGYGDIAVVVRSRGERVQNILSAMRGACIPLRAEGFSDDNSHCRIVVEMLKLINNRRDDVALAASMLSYFGGFSDEDLKEIRLNDRGSKVFFDCVEKYILDKSQSETPSERERAIRLSGFVDYLSRLGKKADDSDIYGLLCEIVYASGYDAFVGEKSASLEKFMEGFIGAEYSLGQYLYDADGINVKTDGDGAAGNRVTVMTVHASKGLEFPIVFLADAAHLFNKEHERKPYAFDSCLKIGFYHRDALSMTQKSSIFKRAINQKKNDEQIQEEARLLYVALTRAKNHLFVTAGGKRFKDGGDFLFKRRASFFDLIRYAAFFDDKLRESFIFPCGDGDGGLAAAPSEGAGDKERDGFDIAAYIDKNLKPKSAVFPSVVKQSATAVSREEFRLDAPRRVFERGNAYHKVMQHISFDLTDARDIAAFIDSLADDGVLTKAEAASVAVSDIQKCLNGPLIGYARQNRYVREKEFMLYVKRSDIYDGGGDEKMLIQGVIDLLIFGADESGSIIVDYKTGAIKDELKSVYKKQLAVYRRTAVSAGIKIDGAYLYSFADGGYEKII
ncbi:MAG: UvrD-helicase domain-containing protein [Clostridiales bacterium]|jgi:ATP-dependent helicase/nuclease subunit A|nr:UvrD-helicase domain-containing protein [Clostridiales bacterium]